MSVSDDQMKTWLYNSEKSCEDKRERAYNECMRFFSFKSTKIDCVKKLDKDYKACVRQSHQYYENLYPGNFREPRKSRSFR
jgi:hypothetical protein